MFALADCRCTLRIVVACSLALACLAAPLPSSAAIPPDTTFRQHRVAALQQVAQVYSNRSTYTNCVRLGFSAAAMAAKLRLWAMGESGGKSPPSATMSIT